MLAYSFMFSRQSKQPDIDADEEEDDPSKEKVDAKDIPTLVATKGFYCTISFLLLSVNHENLAIIT